MDKFSSKASIKGKVTSPEINDLYPERKQRELEYIEHKATKAPYVQDIIRVERECNRGILIVYPKGDDHIAAAGANNVKNKLACERVAKLDPRVTSVVFIGDNLHIINKQAPGNIFTGAKLSTAEEKTYSDVIYKPVYPYTDMILYGNHDGDGRRNEVSDDFPATTLAERASKYKGKEVPASPYCGIMYLDFPAPDKSGRKFVFPIFFTHGNGKGSSDLGALDITLRASINAQTLAQDEREMQVIRQKYGKKTVFIEPALVNFGAHLHAGAKGNFNIPYKVETKNGPVTKYLKVTVVNINPMQEKEGWASKSGLGATSTNQYVYVIVPEKNPDYTPTNDQSEFIVNVNQVNIFSKEFDELVEKYPVRTNEYERYKQDAERFLAQNGMVALSDKYEKQTEQIKEICEREE